MRMGLPLFSMVMASMIAHAGTGPIPIANHGFESDRNQSGVFEEGTLKSLELGRPTGWQVVAADNTAGVASREHVSLGWENLTRSQPVQGPPTPQAVRLISGAVVGQVTRLAWSNLLAGDVLTFTVAAGDPLTHADAERTVHWADDSFVGLSEGLVRRSGSPDVAGWLGGVVARVPVPEPPSGLASGIMGDVALVHVVTEKDRVRPGRVGVFVASLGTLLDDSTGTTSARNASHWDDVRLDVTSSRPFITAFDASPRQVEPGESARLSWEVADATTVVIEPGVGTVPSSGSAVVSPASTTTYRLVASNESGTTTAEATLGVLGPPPYRYYRLIPTGLRDDDAANSVQLAEFQLLLGANRVTGASASNPRGRNPSGEGPQQGQDGNPETKWLDFNKTMPLVLDFGVPAVVDGYRLASANDAPERDPISWRVEGSHDAVHWALLDEQAGHPFPEERRVFTERLAMAGLRGPVLALSAHTSDVVRGQSVALEWTAGNADDGTIRIDPGVGAVGASGQTTVAPLETTTYVLRASKGGVERTRSVTVRVGLHPVPVIVFSATPSAVSPGEPATLAWSVSNATEVAVTPVVGLAAFVGSRVVRPTATTEYTISATGPGGTRTATARVEVSTRGLAVRTFDTLEGDSWLDPIGNLLAARPSSTGLQRDAIDFNGDFVQRLPGLTTPDSFAVLWTGWLDVRVLGMGSYTFGTRSDDGSTLWLDLDNDGKFDGPGERIVDNNGMHPASTATGTVDLQFDMVRVAIGYYEAGGKEVMQARFGKGGGLGFGELDLLPGATDAFSVTEPDGGAPFVRLVAAPDGVPPGGSATLSWKVDKATEVRIEPGVGAVPVTGTTVVSPAADTTYTLTATGPGGTRSASVTVAVVGRGPYRFYRFLPTRLRDPGDNSVQLAEFQLLRQGARIGGATASNPAGDNPGNETPFHGNDNSVDTKWLDFRKGALVLDFGSPVPVDGYRWATANDAEGRDPVSWRVDGSHDGAVWVVLDSRISYPTPRTRKTFIGPFSLVLHPAFRLLHPTRNETGVVLAWESQPGTVYRVETTTHPTEPASWTTWNPSVASTGTSTSLTLPLASEGARFFRVVAMP